MESFYFNPGVNFLSGSGDKFWVNEKGKGEVDKINEKKKKKKER